MKLILLGPPGAGKGTQAKYIVESKGIPAISTGDILRRAMRDGSELGEKVMEHMNAGNLVPDALVIDVMRQRLDDPDCEKGFLLDGFPRTIAQAEALDTFVEIDVVVCIDVDVEELVKRLTGRRSCPECNAVYHVMFNAPKKQGLCDKCGSALFRRGDDNEETVRNRIKTYHEQTEPLIEYYTNKEKIMMVDGARDIEEISKDILKRLG